MRQGAGTLGGASLRVTPGADEGSYSVVVDVDASEGFVNDLHGELLVIDPAVATGDPGQLGADPAWLASLSPEPATSAGPLDDVLTTPGAPRGTRTRPVWPELLWALVLPLLLLDLLLRRVALGRPKRGRLG